MVGNAAKLPHSVLEPARTLTSNIALEMAYASGEHREALFATGVVLFVFGPGWVRSLRAWFRPEPLAPWRYPGGDQ